MEKTRLEPKELFERLVNIFHELNALDQDVKQLMEDAKDEGIEDLTNIKAAAKLKADEKTGTWQKKVDAIQMYLSDFA